MINAPIIVKFPYLPDAKCMQNEKFLQCKLLGRVAPFNLRHSLAGAIFRLRAMQ